MGTLRYSQMLVIVSVVFAPFASAQPNPLSAEGITITGIARAVGIDYFMRTTCLKFFFVNRAKAEKVQSDTMDLGIQFFGKDEFQRAVASELPRRQRELEATGPEMWCRYQRNNLIEIGKTMNLQP